MDKKSITPLKQLLDKVRNQNIDGFPKADDKDILELSDPPYYTACPNPYIKKFIEEHGKPYDPENDDYDRKPFVEDITEGKNSSIYNAFSYHTKVPHKAIINFINHYTENGDIVFDGFCGSGMTAIAAQILGRKAVLGDLSPMASFIAYCYNNPIDPDKFESRVNEILKKVRKECGWMYETNHVETAENTRTGNQTNLLGEKVNGKIEYTVWSDVLICPYCNKEYVFWNVAVDKESKKVNKEYECPNCEAELTKRDSERATETYYDSAIGKEVTQAKQVPVLINYSVGKKRFEKKPDKEDLEKIEKIKEMEIPYWFPTDRMPEGDESRRNDKYGITHVHHFYTKRNLWVLSSIWDKITSLYIKIVLLILLTNNSKMSRYGSRTGNVSGTLYVPSTIKEINVLEYLQRKLYGPKGIIKPIKKLSKKISGRKSIISTNSMNCFDIIQENSVDYIFTDPPFGSNLMYSELNFIWESWLKVFTNNEPEAIVNKTQHKELDDYTELMTQSFKEMYRMLKPNRWMTVVFHNSKASVWNAIQESINRAGFIIAQVTTMDKKQGSFKQVTSAGAVKNDLIINAYKPKKDFEKKFLENAGEGMEVDFIKQQLEHLPLRSNIERTEKMLYSKMLAHYVENGFKIRYDSTNFYQLLEDNFVNINGYWFLDSQVEEYNEWKSQLSLDEMKDTLSSQMPLFITDEKSALNWMYSFLHEPKDYSEIYTAYQQLATTSKDKIPETKELLEKNFIFEDGKYRRPRSQEEKTKVKQNRKKDLDRAFSRIVKRAREGKGKIKNLRKEALIHGFTKWYQQKKYREILEVADRLYKSTLESSGDIMDFVNIARLKTSGSDIKD